MFTSIHLAIKEVWRNRGRFLLFSLVVALITVLILFVAALGEGLGSGNREYIEKLDADLCSNDNLPPAIGAQIGIGDGAGCAGSPVFGQAPTGRVQQIDLLLS